MAPTTVSKQVLPENTFAIIIGISEYAYINGLKYADKDAELFKNFLMSRSGGNVPQIKYPPARQRLGQVRGYPFQGLWLAQ